MELLTEGRISLPVPEPSRSHLRSVRRGEVPLREVLEVLAELEERLTVLQQSADVPAEPDRTWVDGWLHRAHLAYWAGLDDEPLPLPGW